MKVIRSIPVDDGNFVSSTVPEADAAAWAAGTTYAVDALVTRDHRIWKSVQAANTGHEPGTDILWWTDQGPTNRWAMFDKVVGTLTAAIGTMTIVLEPGRIDSLALLDVDAENVTVVMTSGGAVVYSRTISTYLAGGVVSNWYDWYFAPRGRRTSTIFDNIPVTGVNQVTITIAGVTEASAIAVGTLIIGRRLEIGLLEASPTVGINDYSQKEPDAFGNVAVAERAWSKRMEVRCMLPTSRVASIQTELAKLRAQAALWIGEDGYDALTVYGFFKSFSIDLALPNLSYCSLTVEGLT